MNYLKCTYADCWKIIIYYGAYAAVAKLINFRSAYLITRRDCTPLSLLAVLVGFTPAGGAGPGTRVGLRVPLN